MRHFLAMLTASAAVASCTPAMAQGSQGVGVVNKAPPPTAMQMGGLDPNGKLKAMKVDASGNLLISETASASGFTLATANVAASPVTVSGGEWIWSQTCTSFNSGTRQLQVLGPDGATYQNLVGKTVGDTAGGTLIKLGGGAVVRDSLPAGSTGCVSTLTRVQ